MQRYSTLPNTDFHYHYLPVPQHDGIILSKAIAATYSIDVLMRYKETILDGDYELLNEVSLQLLEETSHDSVWAMKLENRGKIVYLIVFGSEL